MPRTILFISHSSDLYGAERSLLDLLEGLDRSAYRPIVALPVAGPLGEKLRGIGVETWVTHHQKWIGGRHVWFARWYRASLNAKAFIQLRRRLQKNRVDLIYTNTSATPMGGLLAQALGLPHLWHIREFVPNQGTSGNFYYGDAFSFRFIDRSSTRIVCNSAYIKRQLRNVVSPDKLSVVYNGLLPTRPATARPRKFPASRENLKLCIVGSLEEKKGQEDAIRALHRLREAGVKATLQIAGNGRNAAHLRSIAVDLGVTDSIDWLGFIDDPAPVYQRADIALICSRREPFGRIAVEASAWGCPVVSSDQGGLTEIVLDGKTGLFYSPGDVDGLLRQILDLVDNSSKYLEFSENAILSAYERFTTMRYVNDIKDILDAMPGEVSE